MDATSFPQGPLSAGLYSFQATYLGDWEYNASPPGDCEPLRVVDANIQITPSRGTNRVEHVRTRSAGHVNVNDGTGFVNAPDGTMITFAFVGAHVGTLSSSSCLTGSGSGPTGR